VGERPRWNPSRPITPGAGPGLCGGPKRTQVPAGPGENPSFPPPDQSQGQRGRGGGGNPGWGRVVRLPRRPKTGHPPFPKGRAAEGARRAERPSAPGLEPTLGAPRVGVSRPRNRRVPRSRNGGNSSSPRVPRFPASRGGARKEIPARKGTFPKAEGSEGPRPSVSNRPGRPRGPVGSLKPRTARPQLPGRTPPQQSVKGRGRFSLWGTGGSRRPYKFPAAQTGWRIAGPRTRGGMPRKRERRRLGTRSGGSRVGTQERDRESPRPPLNAPPEAAFPDSMGRSGRNPPGRSFPPRGARDGSWARRKAPDNRRLVGRGQSPDGAARGPPSGKRCRKEAHWPRPSVPHGNRVPAMAPKRSRGIEGRGARFKGTAGSRHCKDS